MTEWTEKRTERLRELWCQTDPQLSASEIGRLMGITKNMAVGKAHRLQLPARPSPIKRNGPQQIPRAPRLTLTTLAEPILRPVARPTIKRAAQPMRQRAKPGEACCWLVSDGKPYIYCDEPSVSGPSPYCAVHMRMAYGKRAA